MVSILSYKCIILALSIVSALINASVGNGSSKISLSPELAKELRLTKVEKDALDKLKLALPKEPTMPYLDMELFQIRWLRARSLDVGRTLQDLKELIRIRRKQRVANFWKQDWSDLFTKRPHSIDSFDKAGHPILSLEIDKFDLGGIIRKGKTERVHKYLWNMNFKILEYMMECNKMQRNITQFVFLVDMDGYNYFQHACPLCIPIYLHVLEQNERFLPGFTHDVIFINAPSLSGFFLEIARPFLSKHTSRVLKIFDKDKDRWEAYLDSKIDRKQLSSGFGGMKVVD